LQRGGFAGFKNYITIFSNDVFYKVLIQTFYWTGGVVILTILISLYSAHVMNREYYGKKFLQTIFVLPWATAMIVTAVAYKLIYHGEFGYLNKILYSFSKNFENIYWLGQPKLVMPSLIFVGIMVSIPFTTITFLAAMKTVPQELYESADIDGANTIQKFFNITMPSIKHVTTVVVLINIIYVFNSFPIIWVLTHGGPVYRSHIMVTYLYEIAFTRLDFGVASAIAVIIFLIILTISVTYVHFVERD
jgi:multiple sugar transport system permease protein